MKTKKVTFNDKVEVKYYSNTEFEDDDTKSERLGKFTIWFIISLSIITLLYLII